jgi:hypothetical protein
MSKYEGNTRTVQVLQSSKHGLEQYILQAIVSFEQIYGVVITSIDLQHFRAVGSVTGETIECKINLEV